MPRNFVRKDYSKIKNNRARELFELYEDLRYFGWEQDFDPVDHDQNLRYQTLRLARTTVHEAAMKLEYGK